MVTNPAAPVSVDAAAFNIQGTAPADALVRIYTDLNNDGLINGADAEVASQQLTAGATAFAISTPLTQVSDNYFLATAFDGVLPESAPVDVPTITETSQPPSGGGDDDDGGGCVAANPRTPWFLLMGLLAMLVVAGNRLFAPRTRN